MEKGNGYIDLIYKTGIKLPKSFENTAISNKVKLTDFILAFVAYSGYPQLSKKGQSAIFKESGQGKNTFDELFSEELLSIKTGEEISEKDKKEYYLVINIFVQMEKNNILKNVADEMLSGNENKNARKGIETILKHSRYFILYILKTRLDQLDNTKRNEFLTEILDNKLRDFVKVCAEKIFLEIWVEAAKNDPSLVQV